MVSSPMTEKVKMLQGLLYNSRDPELLEFYHTAKKLTQTYNQLDSKAKELKEEILIKLLGFKGYDIWIESPFYCNYGNFISIGENTFINMNCAFLDCNQISIGKNVLIGPNVQIFTTDHPLEASKRVQTKENNQAPYNTFSKPVSIGDNVMIGGGTIILPGIKIGSNTTVGAGSLVSKDLPSNVLAFGNPCKIIKKLND